LNPFRQKKTIFLHLIAVGMVFGLNYYAGYSKNGRDYTPFAVGPYASTSVYEETLTSVTAARRVMTKGNLFGEPDLYEERSHWRGGAVLHPLLAGVLGFATKNLESVWIILHVAIPLLAWLFVYSLLGNFIHNSAYRALGAWLTLLLPFSALGAVTLLGGRNPQPLDFAKLPSPGFAFLALLFTLTALARALTSKSPFRLLIAGGIFGFYFYADPYGWSALFIGLGIAYGLTRYFLVKSSILRSLRFILIPSFLLAAPYLVVLILLPRDQNALLLRTATFTRAPSPTGIALALVFGGLLAFFIYRARRLERTPAFWLTFLTLALITGCGFGLNYQIASGFDYYSNRFFLQNLVQPMVLLMMLAAVGQYGHVFLSGVPARIPMTVLSVALIALSSYRQYQAGSQSAESHRFSDSRNQILLWARTNISPQAVIGTLDPQLMMLIPAITGNWNFVPVGSRSVSSSQEILRRYSLLSTLEKIGPGEVEGRLRHPIQAEKLRHRPPFVLFVSAYLGPELTADLRQFARTIDMYKELTSRKLDYLIIRKGEALDVVKQHFEKVEVAHSTADWQIVRLGKVIPSPRNIASP